MDRVGIRNSHQLTYSMQCTCDTLMTVTIEAWPLRDPGLQPPAVSHGPNFKYQVPLGLPKQETFKRIKHIKEDRELGS